MSQHPRPGRFPQRRSHGCRPQRAFTLIELLVVIAIISILAGILFPAFAQAREKGRQTACMSNMKQLTTAFLMYSEDYDEGFPGAAGHGSLNTACQGSPDDNWVRGEWIDNTTRSCPSNQLPVPNGALYTYVKNQQVYMCITDSLGSEHTLSYAMNSNLGEQGLPSMQAPSSCILLVDEENNKNSQLDDGYFAAPSANLPTGGADWPADRPTGRHNGGGNLAFGDGHAKWYRPTQIKAQWFDPSWYQ